MKKITLIATVALATASIAIGAKVNADTTASASVNAKEGISTVDISSKKNALDFDFNNLTFAEDGTGSLASQDLTITSTLSNKSFGAKQVTLSVSTPGDKVAPGLKASLKDGTIEADQATEKTQESTVTVDLDAKAFDSTKITEDSNPYVVTVKASDVTPVTPEG